MANDGTASAASGSGRSSGRKRMLEESVRGLLYRAIFGHFAAITRGVVDLRDLVYFLSLMVAFLAANAILVDLKKAD